MKAKIIKVQADGIWKLQKAEHKKYVFKKDNLLK